MKYFLSGFRYNMKNKAIASIAHITIQARDQVEKIKAQKNIVGNS